MFIGPNENTACSASHKQGTLNNVYMKVCIWNPDKWELHKVYLSTCIQGHNNIAQSKYDNMYMKPQQRGIAQSIHDKVIYGW